jgi:hypothetical protein
MNNPSLRETPVHEPADVIASQQRVSLLDWLRATGRLMERDAQEPSKYAEEEEEISELIVDDGAYDEDEDEDDFSDD